MSQVEQLAVLGIDEEDARRALRATGGQIAICNRESLKPIWGFTMENPIKMDDLGVSLF